MTKVLGVFVVVCASTLVSVSARSGEVTQVTISGSDAVKIFAALPGDSSTERSVTDVLSCRVTGTATSCEAVIPCESLWSPDDVSYPDLQMVWGGQGAEAIYRSLSIAPFEYPARDPNSKILSKDAGYFSCSEVTTRSIFDGSLHYKYNCSLMDESTFGRCGY